MMGIDAAEIIADGIEYIWNKNKAVIHFVEQTEPADGVRLI